VSEPLVQVRLGEVAQCLAAAIQPGQQVEGGREAGAGEVGRSSGEGPAGGGPASAAQHEPVRERPDQSGMVSRFIAQQMLQPGRQALQVLVAYGQDARVDQHFSDVMQGLGLRQVIEQVVGYRVACPGQAAEQPG
jgi:hypothetical protein